MPSESLPNWSAFPGIAYTLSFEANFDVNYHRDWFAKYWSVSIALAVAYVLAVHYGTRFMASRRPLDLRKPLIVWSFSLFLFSVYGCLRVLPELFATFNHRGLEAVICDREFLKDVRVPFAMGLFVWSKAFELIDTFFIVARKQELIFLHWYHHCATLIYGFYSYSTISSLSRPQSAMNYFIHAMMYGYYTCRAPRIYVPRPISVLITILQIAQMVVGVVISLSALAVNANGGTCMVGRAQVVSSLILYSSFLILFANFFVSTYMLDKNIRKYGHEKRLKNS